MVNLNYLKLEELEDCEVALEELSEAKMFLTQAAAEEDDKLAMEMYEKYKTAFGIESYGPGIYFNINRLLNKIDYREREICAAISQEGITDRIAKLTSWYKTNIDKKVNNAKEEIASASKKLKEIKEMLEATAKLQEPPRKATVNKYAPCLLALGDGKLNWSKINSYYDQSTHLVIEDVWNWMLPKLQDNDKVGNFINTHNVKQDVVNLIKDSIKSGPTYKQMEDKIFGSIDDWVWDKSWNICHIGFTHKNTQILMLDFGIKDGFWNKFIFTVGSLLVAVLFVQMCMSLQVQTQSLNVDKLCPKPENYKSTADVLKDVNELLKFLNKQLVNVDTLGKQYKKMYDSIDGDLNSSSMQIYGASMRALKAEIEAKLKSWSLGVEAMGKHLFHVIGM